MRFLFLLGAAFILAHGTAGAQTSLSVCAYGPAPCEAYAGADAVFVGTVTKIVPETTRMGQTYADYDQTAYVSVEKVYKGYKGRRIVLRQFGRRLAQKFILGGRYLFYANHDRAARLWEVRPCGRTLLAVHSQLDLRYIEGLPANIGRTHVSGMVGRYDPGPNAETTGVDRLAGIRVRVFGREGEFETLTNASGLYEFHALPAGRYKIEARVPNGLVLFGALHSGRDRLARARELEFDLGERGCAELTLLFMHDKTLKPDEKQVGRVRRLTRGARLSASGLRR